MPADDTSARVAASADKPLSFGDAITALYATNEHPIAPFIGSAWETGSSGALRLMSLGINAYVDDAQFARAEHRPEWFSSWYRNEGTYRYQRRLLRDAARLAAELTGPESGLLEGLAYTASDSLFATNAVKWFLPRSEGLHASDVEASLFVRGREQLRRELDLMAGHHRLPHVVLVFGLPFWGYARSVFTASNSNWDHASKVESYAATGTLEAWATRVVVQTIEGAHTLLLLRVRHPAARSRLGSAQWLLETGRLLDWWRLTPRAVWVQLSS